MSRAKRASNDTGIQPFQKSKDESFMEFMQRTTWFDQMTKAVFKHSDAMRPWASPNFPSMEYSFPPPPTWNSLPELPIDPVVIDPTTPDECHTCMFSGTVEYPSDGNKKQAQFCWPYGGVFCMDPQTHKAWDEYQKTGIVPQAYAEVDPSGAVRWSTTIAFSNLYSGLQFKFYQTSGTDGEPIRCSFREAMCNSCAVCVRPTLSGGWDFSGGTVTMYMEITDQYGNKCSDTKSIYSDCCFEAGYVAPSWDVASSDSIGPGGEARLWTDGGCGPIRYYVSGTGYTLSHDSGGGGEELKVFSADGSCGTNYGATAQVRALDKCGNSATKYLQNTGGSWHGATFGCTAFSNCDEQGAGPGDMYYDYTEFTDENKNRFRWMCTNRSFYAHERGCNSDDPGECAASPVWATNAGSLSDGNCNGYTMSDIPSDPGDASWSCAGAPPDQHVPVYQSCGIQTWEC